MATGHRAAVTDLRGHGGSDASFAQYGDGATADDIAPLVGVLGGPAVIVGNFMAAGSAVLLAAQHPELVAGLVLVDPFVRDPKSSAVKRLMMRVVLAPPWVAATWKSYLPKLYAGTKPPDFDDYRSSVAAGMKRPGHAKAFSITARTSHAAAEQALGRVHAPTLVVMGERDPDFPDPAAEARWIADQLHGEVVLIPDAAHYPQSQRPELVSSAIESFLDRVGGDT